MLGDVTEADLQDEGFAFWVHFRLNGWPVEPFTSWPLTVAEVVRVCDESYFSSGKAVEEESPPV